MSVGVSVEKRSRSKTGTLEPDTLNLFGRGESGRPVLTNWDLSKYSSHLVRTETGVP